MQFNLCFFCLLLGIALIQAVPAPKSIEKKSLAEESKVETPKEEGLKLEEPGEEKDRAKKAAFCVQLEPGYIPQNQIAINENPVAFPLTIQSQPQVQTLSFVQAVPQNIPQANLIVPQQMVHPVHTLQFLQPPSQPCAQTSVNILQPPSSQTTTVEKPKALPKPNPPQAKETAPVTEPPKPMRMENLVENLPVPHESYGLMPSFPACDHFMLYPHIRPPPPPPPAYIQVPQAPQGPVCNNPYHGLITECTCHSVDPIGVSTIPHAPQYQSNYPSSQLVMPNHLIAKQTIGSDGKSKTYISTNNFHARHHHPQRVYQKLHVHGGDTNQVAEMLNAPYVPGMSINPYAAAYRSYDPNTMQQRNAFPFTASVVRNKHNAENAVDSEVYDLMQSNKATREVDPSQLSPEKVEQIKQEEEKAMLIDGRRNTRSNKEEKKSAKN